MACCDWLLCETLICEFAFVVIRVLQSAAGISVYSRIDDASLLLCKSSLLICKSSLFTLEYNKCLMKMLEPGCSCGLSNGKGRNVIW